MAQPSVTFNVIYTRGTVARLLPFALSLLGTPGVRIRAVSNGCEDGETELLARVAASDDRLSHHQLPYSRSVELGHALNHLFESFPEPRFGLMDSDVIAGGDFSAFLAPPARGQAAVFTAPPVWSTEESRLRRTSPIALSGHILALRDGTAAGSTFCAIYEREPLEPIWRKTPKGFCGHHGHQVPRSLRARLAERGWAYRTYDTGRLINLQLLLAGATLQDRFVPELHHAGGTSVRIYRGPRGAVRRGISMLRDSPDGRRFRRIPDGFMTRYFFWRHRRSEPTLRPVRRNTVVGYLDGVIDALATGTPVPEQPRTDSEEVDRAVGAMAEALRDQYPKGVEMIRAACAEPLQPSKAGARL